MSAPDPSPASVPKSKVARLIDLAELFQGVHCRLAGRLKNPFDVPLAWTLELEGRDLINRVDEPSPVYDPENRRFAYLSDAPASPPEPVLDRLAEEFGPDVVTWGQVVRAEERQASYGWVPAWFCKLWLWVPPVMMPQPDRDDLAHRLSAWAAHNPDWLIAKSTMYKLGERVTNPKDPTGEYYFGLSYRGQGWMGGRYLCWREKTGAKKARGQKLVSLNSLRPFTD